MRFLRTIRTALRAITRNVMRAVLTTLGIIIGIAAVIAMMEIGRGSAALLQHTISRLGANTILVFPGNAAAAGVSQGAGSSMTLTPQDSDAIMDQCPAVSDAAPVIRARAQVIYENRNWVCNTIYGTTPEFLSIRDWANLAEGTAFTPDDVQHSSEVCLVGQTLVHELFSGASPLGKEVRVQNVRLKIIGVLASKGANMMGQDQDDILLVPWTTIKFRITGSSAGNVNQSANAAASSSSTANTVNTVSNLYPSTSLDLYPTIDSTQSVDQPMPIRFINVDQILVAVHNVDQIPAALVQVSDVLDARHRIKEEQPEDFTTRDMTEITRVLSTSTTTMTKLLLAVALISLVVGGVGIMNIMLVSVTERTREIGLRMAVGARPADILRQFLIEAVVLCVLGGCIGILLGRGSSYLIRKLLHWPTEISVPAIIAAVVVSVTVGVVFGFYPAWKASRLDPIEALRYE